MTGKTQTDKEIQGARRIGNSMVKRLYSVQEAAYYLGRSDYSLRSLIWGGKLPVVKENGRGRKQWLDVQDLDAFIDQNKVEHG